MNSKVFDYIIIGAGPAGLQLGSLLQNSETDYLILESGESAGSFFKQYPRHRKLISINKKYTGDSDSERNLRMDWNSLLSDNKDLLFTRYTEKYFPSADVFVKYLKDFSETQNLNIIYQKKVVLIEKEDIFSIKTASGEVYHSRVLIVATGVSQENIPAIPGIEYVEKYSETDIDPLNYVNQRVLILGKGNSAFETADNLVETTAAVHVAGPSSLKFAWQTHFVGHLRAVNNNILDTYQLKSQNAILDGNVVSIKKEDDKFTVLFSFIRSGEIKKELSYDRIICCTGFKFDSRIFAGNIKPRLTINNRFPELTSSWESVNVPDLYFAGTLMQQRDYKKSTSGFVHGFRYSVRSLFHILNQRYANLDFPHQLLSSDAGTLADFIVKRVNNTSALWQQFEFMADCLILDSSFSLYIKELPVAFMHDNYGAAMNTYLLITLEYGPDHAKVAPFDVTVERIAQDDHMNALNAQYLHPVLRFYVNGQLASEHHMAENLENEWSGQASHVLPLVAYLEKCIVAPDSHHMHYEQPAMEAS